MGALITILILALLIYAIVRNNAKRKNSSKLSEQTVKSIAGNVVEDSKINAGSLTILHTRVFERKTFIKGELKSKYYGEIDRLKESMNFVKERFYDCTLYEAEIRSASFRRNNDGPFPEFLETEVFRGNISPNPLPCIIEYKGVSGEYSIQLFDIKLASIQIDQKLHQVEEREVFGTLYADVTGYLLEEFTEQWEEQVPVSIEGNPVTAEVQKKIAARNANALHPIGASADSTKLYRN